VGFGLFCQGTERRSARSQGKTRGSNEKEKKESGAALGALGGLDSASGSRPMSTKREEDNFWFAWREQGPRKKKNTGRLHREGKRGKRGKGRIGENGQEGPEYDFRVSAG